jgi:hypothetical protein
MTGTVGVLCHHMHMTDALGVDLDIRDTSAPFVVTAELPESVVRNAEFVLKLRERREWNSARARGEIPASRKTPPGLAQWEAWVGPLGAGLFVAVAFGILVQLITEGLGHLFGFRPGPVGVIMGLVAGFLTCTALWSFQEDKRHRDIRHLEANQRKITDSLDRSEMLKAHRAAMTVVKLWPNLPVPDGPVEPRLRRALWELAGVVPERRALAATLADLRQATVGVPTNDPAAAELAIKIARADALHRAKDTEVRERIGHLSELAARCQRFDNEQLAIRRARQVSRQADAVLGTVTTAVPQSREDIGSFTQQVAVVLDAYREVGRDVGNDS